MEIPHWHQIYQCPWPGLTTQLITEGLLWPGLRSPGMINHLWMLGTEWFPEMLVSVLNLEESRQLGQAGHSTPSTAHWSRKSLKQLRVQRKGIGREEKRRCCAHLSSITQGTNRPSGKNTSLRKTRYHKDNVLPKSQGCCPCIHHFSISFRKMANRSKLQDFRWKCVGYNLFSRFFSRLFMSRWARGGCPEMCPRSKQWRHSLSTQRKMTCHLSLGEAAPKVSTRLDFVRLF